jgi:hypothetical protein
MCYAVIADKAASEWNELGIDNFYRCTAHLDVIKVFHSPTDALLIILENSKIYIKTSIKVAATCFVLRLSSGSLQYSLAKVTLMLKQSIKLRCYVLCGGVATCYAATPPHNTST